MSGPSSRDPSPADAADEDPGGARGVEAVEPVVEPAVVEPPVVEPAVVEPAVVVDAVVAEPLPAGAAVGPAPAHRVGRPPTRGPRAWIEHFTLRAAAEISARLSDEARARARDAVALLAQRKRAAEFLWYAGHRAEGLALAERTLVVAVEAAEQIAGEADTDAALRAVGIDAGSIDVALEIRALAAEDPRRLDASLRSADERVFRDTISLVERIERVVGGASLSKPQLVLTRARRLGFLVATSVAAVVALAYWIHEPTRIEVEASSQHPSWPGDFAVDAKPETEWLGHDQVRPTLTLRMYPDRHVTKIRVLNGHNRHYNDRAVREYRIELYRGSELAETVLGRFDRIEPEPEWVTHEVDHRDIDRLRFVVRSFHGTGSALAELEVTQTEQD